MITILITILIINITTKITAIITTITIVTIKRILLIDLPELKMNFITKIKVVLKTQGIR